MQNCVLKWRNIASFLIFCHCQRAIFFLRAIATCANCFLVRANGTVALKVAQLLSTDIQYTTEIDSIVEDTPRSFLKMCT